jgi:hypothetical protein
VDKENFELGVDYLTKFFFILSFIVGYIKYKKDKNDDYFHQQCVKDCEERARRHFYDIR